MLWAAYELLDKDRVRGSGSRVLTDLVSLVRFTLQQDIELIPYQDAVEERFEGWLLAQQQMGREFSPEQYKWLGMIKDHIATSLSMSQGDFDFVPFNEQGGLGKAWDLFGENLGGILDELTETLVA
jgi:type I restriction enzyme R subunit